MSDAKIHHKLFVWQEAMNLADMVLGITRTFPRDEMCGLGAQMRKAALSVPSNLAEGAGRNGPKELLQFVGIATGSLAELEIQDTAGACSAAEVYGTRWQSHCSGASRGEAAGGIT